MDPHGGLLHPLVVHQRLRVGRTQPLWDSPPVLQAPHERGRSGEQGRLRLAGRVQLSPPGLVRPW